MPFTRSMNGMVRPLQRLQGRQKTHYGCGLLQTIVCNTTARPLRETYSVRQQLWLSRTSL